MDYLPDESTMSPHERALNALHYEIGRNSLDYTDNYRIARRDDDRAVEAYLKQVSEGCCGFFDTYVTIDTIEYMIGCCNHGH